MSKKDFKKMQDAAFGGALALQSTRLLSDRSTAGLIGTTEGFVGIGVAGAVANVSYNMVSGKKKRKRR